MQMVCAFIVDLAKTIVYPQNNPYSLFIVYAAPEYTGFMSTQLLLFPDDHGRNSMNLLSKTLVSLLYTPNTVMPVMKVWLPYQKTTVSTVDYSVMNFTT